MKRYFLIIPVLILLTAFDVYPTGITGGRYYKEIKPCLDSLDKYIAEADTYTRKKEERIAVILEHLKDNGITLYEQYIYTYLLFEEYSTYKSEPMHSTAHRLIELSERLGDKNKVINSEVQLAYSYLWCGAFKEAYQYANKIDTTATSVNTRANYLMFLLNLEYEAALFVKPSRYFIEDYDDSMRRIITELEALLPDRDDDRLLEARQKASSHNNNYTDAYAYLVKRLENSSGVSREMAAKLGDVGFFHLEMGDTVTAVRYMVESAITDIKIGSRQAPALRKIAEAIYPAGDVERAYRYIQMSMDNAVFFDSRYRMYESSIALPQIDRDLYELTKKQKDLMKFALLVIFLFILALGAAVVFIWGQNKKLKSSASLIRRQNESLSSLNESTRQINLKLKEANNIKDAYLGRILSDNSTSIGILEELIRMLKVKIKAKRYDEIIPYIYERGYNKLHKEMLARFDKMFLMLFPNFIDKFNSLLKDEDKIVVEGKDVLTPELRIFALVRLGVSKSDTIADILNLSSSTVRNYKTKIRNISVISNEEFDRHLLGIDTDI